MEDFLRRFHFQPDFEGYIGVEREMWTVSPGTKNLVAVTPLIFAHHPEGRIKPELPVHQIEVTTKPCVDINRLTHDLARLMNVLKRWGQEFCFEVCHECLPPSAFEVEVYPKPRYLDILEHLGPERLRNGWITSVHIHYGCRDFGQAIRILNHIRTQLDYFSKLSTFGAESKRLEVYAKMCSEIVPPVIDSTEHLYELARNRGFNLDPRSCWWGVRISPHGTVEVRIFDNHPDLDVPFLAREVQRAAQVAL